MTDESIVGSIEEGDFRGESLGLRWAGVSHVGKLRSINEDSLGLFGGFLVVADGMGGHEAGDVASRVAVETVGRWALGVPIPLEQLDSLVDDINSDVRHQAQLSGFEGMGTTLVGVVCIRNALDEGLAVVNVGDSRCYGIESGRSELLTVDHSLVQELVDAGSIAADDAEQHPDRNVVTRAIGVEERVAADYVVLEAGRFDRLVLCSDGVSSELASNGLDALLGADGPCGAVAAEIMGAVLTGRARDNASVVVIDIDWGVEKRPIDSTAPSAPADHDTTPRSQASTPPSHEDTTEAGTSGSELISDTPTAATHLEPVSTDPRPSLIDGVPEASVPLSKDDGG